MLFRSRPSALLVLAALAACRDSTGSGAEALAFTAPLPGAAMEDFFHGAYLDHDGGGGVRDYHCGAKAYDGHGGVDLLLRNFREQDAGVPVVAAADGVVTSAVGNLADRNTSWEGTSGFGNHVALSHSGGVVSIYGHLRLGSLAVAVGDRVERGALLGLVGSSGRSNWPHLHFEVRQGGASVDPFTGACGPAQGMWAAQLPYQDGFRVTDAGLTDQPVSLAALLERPPTLTSVTAGSSGVVFWLQLVNQRAAAMRYELRSPGGAVVQEFSHQVGATFSMRFLAVTLAVPVDAAGGAWEVRAFQDDVLLRTLPFTVVAGAGAGMSGADAAAWIAALEVEVLDQAPGGGPAFSGPPEAGSRFPGRLLRR